MITNLLELGDRLGGFLVPSAHLEDKGSFSSIPDLTQKVNDSFMLIFVISIVLLVLVTAFMVYFVVRYHHKRNPRASEVKEPLLLEIAWTVIPTILVFIMFWVGWKNYLPLRHVPENAMVVKVTARMWGWKFQYPNGTKSDILRVPAGKPIQLLMTSDDVLHSLFIPALKLKEDVVPGMETTMWFHSEKEGEYDIYCTEYCGVGHSAMNTKVIAMSAENFSDWYAVSRTPEEPGKVISVENLINDTGCLDCHSIDGSEAVGPTFKGIFNRRHVVITDGKKRTITVDDEYIRRAILYPEADIVQGYPEVMPSYKGDFSEMQLNAVIEYLKSVR